mmetsp:Transcript_659/g.1544  ORF Transcript_659/g.1544 Transcript_659/m.1544 type:complete len:113 (+) Transcript_659:405-743(+)
MISSNKNRNVLTLPKGGWEEDETLEDAAVRETIEEAGVRGELQGPKLGPYSFLSKRSGKCKAYMYIMKVEEELNEWPEKHVRVRVWCSLEKAINSCKWEWMKEVLRAKFGEA